MSQRLKIKLYDGWRPVENEGGPASYANGDSCLQFSERSHKNGPVSIDAEGLISICEKLTKGIRGRRDVMSGSGKCEHGIFGTVIAKGDSPAYVQAWVLSNNTDFILVTHTCESEPKPEIVTQASSIALMTTLGPHTVQ